MKKQNKNEEREKRPMTETQMRSKRVKDMDRYIEI